LQPLKNKGFLGLVEPISAHETAHEAAHEGLQLPENIKEKHPPLIP